MDRNDIMRLAESQHGVVARRQVDAEGSAVLATGIRTGDWLRVHAGVYRRRGSPLTPEQGCIAAVLRAGPDSAGSHSSASAVWRLPGFDLRRPEVIRRRATRSTSGDGITIHEPRLLLDHHIVVHRGIPVTTPARTLFDLAAVVPLGRLARLTDRALAQRLTTATDLHRRLDELRQRGRTGIRNMRIVLSERPIGYVAPESGLETRMAHLLRQAGLPHFRRQVDLGGEEWIGRVDFHNADLGLVIEVQSELFHASLSDRAADERRRAALEALGVHVVEVWDSDLWHRAPAVMTRLRQEVSRRAAA